MGYLCKYLTKAGYEPYVLTETSSDRTFAFLDGYCPVERLTYYCSGNSITTRFRNLFRKLMGVCFNRKEEMFYKRACELHEKYGFAAVLCSAYREFPLDSAMRTAKRYGLPLTIDLRDIIEQYAADEFIPFHLPFFLKWIAPIFRRHCLNIRNKALKEAKAVTTVSPWHVEQLKKYNDNVHLIYNGYDPEVFKPEIIETSQFIITYTGRVQSLVMRDPSLLFGALIRLTESGILSPDICRVKWYTDEASRNLIREVATRAGVAEYMDYYDYAPADDIPDILNGSSVLLLLANKAAADGPKGIMTTKVFESLAVAKPVLCVRSDESYLAALLEETAVGVAAVTVDETAEFILKYYRQWEERHYTISSDTHSLPTIYSRAEQAEQFMAVLHL
jgi:glycosyltransferase involved in cell wall biosynthesis